MTLDPRLNPFRRDIAARHLQGQVEAAQFVDGTVYEVIEPIADLRREPAHEAALDTQALKGERVTVVLNGQTVIDKALLPGIAPAGPIALQYHGDQIEFANLFIKEL